MILLLLRMLLRRLLTGVRSGLMVVKRSGWPLGGSESSSPVRMIAYLSMATGQRRIKRGEEKDVPLDPPIHARPHHRWHDYPAAGTDSRIQSPHCPSHKAYPAETSVRSPATYVILFHFRSCKKRAPVTHSVPPSVEIRQHCSIQRLYVPNRMNRSFENWQIGTSLFEEAVVAVHRLMSSGSVPCTRKLKLV